MHQEQHKSYSINSTKKGDLGGYQSGHIDGCRFWPWVSVLYVIQRRDGRKIIYTKVGFGFAVVLCEPCLTKPGKAKEEVATTCCVVTGHSECGGDWSGWRLHVWRTPASLATVWTTSLGLILTHSIKKRSHIQSSVCAEHPKATILKLPLLCDYSLLTLKTLEFMCQKIWSFRGFSSIKYLAVWKFLTLYKFD